MLMTLTPKPGDERQVVIINFPDTGHINPTLPLVAELSARKVQEILEHYLHPDAPAEEGARGAAAVVKQFRIEEWESHEIVQMARKEILESYAAQLGAWPRGLGASWGILGHLGELVARPGQGAGDAWMEVEMEMDIGPQLKRFGDFPFHCVGPLLDGKLKRVAHAAADQPEEAVPWDVIDESVAAGRGAPRRLTTRLDPVALVQLGAIPDQRGDRSYRFGDQPYNADAVASLGCGVSFRYPLQTLTALQLRRAVRGLLDEPCYHSALAVPGSWELVKVW
eukprot:Skav229408  [mRNA]  locus=scaffold2297:62917:68812:+ [translate_table: standard]